jgi:hypothetical protein
MKRNLLLPVILFIFFVFCNSCTKDFIEQNITGQTIQLMAPANGLQSATDAQIFWWNSLDGAEQYELQIVKGSFSYVVRLMLDTVITTNKFNYTLYPGSYQWRVRGMNNGGNTQFSTFSLTIDSNTNMSAQVVILVSPANNIYTNALSNTFKWDSVFGAIDYRLEIINNNTSATVLDTALKKEAFTQSLSPGAYTWEVRAENSDGTSAFTSETITIDTSRPNAPLLLTPKNDSTTSSTKVAFTWSNEPVVSGVPIMDSLYIYANASMTTIVRGTFTSLTSYNDTLTAGTYYWRVRSIDAAGNKSAYSALWKLTTP